MAWTTASADCLNSDDAAKSFSFSSFRTMTAFRWAASMAAISDCSTFICSVSPCMALEALSMRAWNSSMSIIDFSLFFPLLPISSPQKDLWSASSFACSISLATMSSISPFTLAKGTAWAQLAISISAVSSSRRAAYREDSPSIIGCFAACTNAEAFTPLAKISFSFRIASVSSAAIFFRSSHSSDFSPHSVCRDCR